VLNEGVQGGGDDHGSQFVADDYQRELAFLGVGAVPSGRIDPQFNSI
jgi:hypothetical protein